MGDATCFIPAEKGNNRGSCCLSCPCKFYCKCMKVNQAPMGISSQAALLKRQVGGWVFLCLFCNIFLWLRRNIVKISNYILQTLQFRIIRMILND